MGSLGRGRRLHPCLPGGSEQDDDCCGDWAPDGRQFVFRRYRDERSDIWAIREGIGPFGGKSGELTRLTSRPAPLSGSRPEPRWPVAARDRRAAARRDPAVRPARREFVPTLPGFGPGGSHSPGTESGSPTSNTGPRGTSSGGAGWTAAQRLQLTQPPMRLLLPRWSPDGQRIVFMGKAAPGGPWKIYAVTADGGEPSRSWMGTVTSQIPTGRQMGSRSCSAVLPTTWPSRPCRRPFTSST